MIDVVARDIDGSEAEKETDEIVDMKLLGVTKLRFLDGIDFGGDDFRRK